MNRKELQKIVFGDRVIAKTSTKTLTKGQEYRVFMEGPSGDLVIKDNDGNPLYLNTYYLNFKVVDSKKAARQLIKNKETAKKIRHDLAFYLGTLGVNVSGSVDFQIDHIIMKHLP